jgi:hypothetical protein
VVRAPAREAAAAQGKSCSKRPRKPGVRAWFGTRTTGVGSLERRVPRRRRLRRHVGRQLRSRDEAIALGRAGAAGSNGFGGHLGTCDSWKRSPTSFHLPLSSSSIRCSEGAPRSMAKPLRSSGDGLPRSSAAPQRRYYSDCCSEAAPTLISDRFSPLLRLESDTQRSSEGQRRVECRRYEVTPGPAAAPSGRHDKRTATTETGRAAWKRANPPSAPSHGLTDARKATLSMVTWLRPRRAR